jgi:hypothetical protein
LFQRKSRLALEVADITRIMQQILGAQRIHLGWQYRKVLNAIPCCSCQLEGEDI